VSRLAILKEVSMLSANGGYSLLINHPSTVAIYSSTIHDGWILLSLINIAYWMEVLLHSETKELLLDDCIDYFILSNIDGNWIGIWSIVNGILYITIGSLLNMESDENIANEDKVLY
jgi:hypothetical protein